MPKPTPESFSTKPGVREVKHSFSFRIDSKSFLLAFDGGHMDAYAITENRGRYHSSIRVGRSGLDWTIACLVELCRWDFSKKHFFKRFHERYKILEFSSRSNKSGLFVEISEYHNGARRGCLCIPEGKNKGGWAFFELKLREFFLGKSASRPGKEVVAGGGGLETSTRNSRNQIWKNLNGGVNSGRELCLEYQFPNIPRNLNQKESFGGFDFLQNSNKHPINSYPLCGPSARWTQAHFSLKITAAFDGHTQRQVRWSTFVKPTGAKLGPVPSDQAQRVKPTKAQNEFIKNLERLTKRSSWEVEEGSGLHAEKAPKLSPITGELGGDLPRADECVEDVLTCDFLAGPHCSDGPDPHGSAEKLLLVVPVSDELGGVFPRSNGYGDEIGAVGGLPVGHKSSGAEASCVGDTVIVADSPAEDFPNSGVVQNSIGQSVNADSDASPSLSVFEFSDMVRHHKLLGKNRFYPLSELGFDSKEEEILLLDWVNPKGSSQDEESRNALDCVPLAKWDPHGGLDIVSEAVLDDFLVGEDLEPSVVW
nr:hypothetical protein CFP56_39757 [Quercus suber]